jgi:hypothetical protein
LHVDQAVPDQAAGKASEHHGNICRNACAARGECGKRPALGKWRLGFLVHGDIVGFRF